MLQLNGLLAILAIAQLQHANPVTQWSGDGVDVKLTEFWTRTASIFDAPWGQNGYPTWGDREPLLAFGFNLIPQDGYAISRDHVITLVNAVDASGDDVRVKIPSVQQGNASVGDLFGTARSSQKAWSSTTLITRFKTLPEVLSSIDGHVDVDVAIDPEPVTVVLAEGLIEREIFPGLTLCANVVRDATSDRAFDVTFSLTADPNAAHYSVPLIGKRVKHGTISTESIENAFGRSDTQREFTHRAFCLAANQIELEFHGLGPFKKTRIPISTGPFDIWHPGHVPTAAQNLQQEFVTVQDDYEVRLLRAGSKTRWSTKDSDNRASASVWFGVMDRRLPADRRRYSCNARLSLYAVETTDNTVVKLEDIVNPRHYIPGATLEFGPRVLRMPDRDAGPLYLEDSASIPFESTVAPRSLQVLAGEMTFQEVTKQTTVDIPLEGAPDREVAAGVRVRVDDVSAKKRRNGYGNINWEVVITTTSPDLVEFTSTPSVNDIAVLDESGRIIELSRQLSRKRTTTGYEIALQSDLQRHGATAIRLDIVQEARVVTIPFRFENVPLQSR